MSTTAAPSPIAFIPRANGFTATLGVWAIGEVVETGDAGYPAAWRLNLTGVSSLYRYARTMDAARTALMRKAMEWIDAAGLAPALPIEGVIRAERDGQRQGGRT